MTVWDATELPAVAVTPVIRRITENDLDWALAEGWKDFREKRGDILVLALLYPFIGFVTATATLNGQFLPLFFPLVAGISLLGPAAASGFYEIARRREAGLDSSWLHFIDPLRGRGRLGLAALTAGMIALFAIWLLAAALIAATTIGDTNSMTLPEFVREVLTTPQGWTLIIVGNLVGFAFAVATLVLSLVSFPMLVDGAAGPMTAALTSVQAARRNPRVTAACEMRVAGLLVLGALPAFMGLAIVLPVLGYATWHLYTRLVDRRA